MEIQIQLLLKLNENGLERLIGALKYSNTTLVKVKFGSIADYFGIPTFKYNSC